MEFIEKYLGTVIAATILGAIIVLALIKIIKNKKSGKNSCGGDCGNCSGDCGKNVLHEENPLPLFRAGNTPEDESEKQTDGKDKRNENS